MAEVTLKVPVEHIDPFRLAVLDEIRYGGEYVTASAVEMLEDCRKADDPSEPNPGDVYGSARCLGEDVEIFRQVVDGCADVGGKHLPVTTTDPGALAHIARTMADKVIAPQIAEEANVSPYGEETAAKLAELSAALGWAAGEAARLEAIAVAEIKSKKAEAV